MTRADHQRVGFVVIGRNEGERLGQSLRTLRAVSNQVVYVDSGSSDGSVDLARDLGAIAVELDDSAPHTAARGRNAGFHEIRERFPACEFVQFIDGDCILEPGWLESATRFLDDNPKAAVACGRRIEAHPDESLYNRLIDEEWNTPVGRAEYSGGDSLVRVSAFEQIGGFRPELKAGEEPEMTTRLRAEGWEIWRIDAPMTIHDARIHRFGQWWTRSVRGGFGYAEVWSTTAQLPRRAFDAQLRRAFFWSLGVPLIVVIAALLIGRPIVLLALPLIYAAQILRMTVRRGVSVRALQSAGMVMLAKLPETIGALNYFLGRKSNRLADYKSATG
jgi:cellulose synthase/poly-beta-1,6-N-acetylglucosamine synthase-like glycosyltransferase